MKTINEANYVDEAEKVIKNLSGRINQKTGKPIPMVTTSKIRNLLSMTADIYNNVMNLQDDILTKELSARIEYLRVRFVYECGREAQVKSFVNEARILEILKEIGNKRENYILFSHYMEALVAFHRFNGGKD